MKKPDLNRMTIGINMKKSMNILYLLSVLLCVSCAKEPADEGKRPGGSGNNNGSQTETLKITPFEELNAGTVVINSHENEWQASSLKMDQRSYIELGPENSVNLPTYSRICRLDDGSYILTWQKGRELCGFSFVDCNFTHESSSLMT